MQTFMPYPDFQQSAQCLDNRRLGKQRVEVLQILNTLDKGPFICSICKTTWDLHINNSISGHKKINTPWYNHPAVQMWKGYERALVNYGLVICNEWKNRLFKDTCEGKIAEFDDGNDIIIDPPWLGNEQFHASHRSQLLKKFPEHYSKFGWLETPDQLEYWWPTKNLE